MEVDLRPPGNQQPLLTYEDEEAQYEEDLQTAMAVSASYPQRPGRRNRSSVDSEASVERSWNRRFELSSQQPAVVSVVGGSINYSSSDVGSSSAAASGFGSTAEGFNNQRGGVRRGSDAAYQL